MAGAACLRSGPINFDQKSSVIFSGGSCRTTTQEALILKGQVNGHDLMGVESGRAGVRFSRRHGMLRATREGSSIEHLASRRCLSLPSSSSIGVNGVQSIRRRGITTVCEAATQVQEREQGVEETNGKADIDSELRALLTGGAVDFSGANNPLIKKALETEKTIVMVRHGLSTWNFEGRVQGSSDESILSETGIWQAERCKGALSKLKFDQCFASPISRAKTSAEVIWQDREEPLIFLDSLREANLNILEGMKNSEAKKMYPELFTSWREDPMHFEVNGVYPVRELWDHARHAWEDILTQATGDLVLVVAHKSVLRAMLCTALGMGPDRFRAMDINNGGICVFGINTRGEPMLKSLNLTSHLQADGVYYKL